MKLRFQIFTTSCDLRRMLQHQHGTVPKSPNSIRKLVFDYAEFVKGMIRAHLADLRKQRRALSLTMDEYSKLTKRYLPIRTLISIPIF